MTKRHKNRSGKADNPQYTNNASWGFDLNQLIGLLGGNTNGNQAADLSGGNFDINQLTNLLGGNIDIGQIQNLLKGMNTEGFDMGSLGNLSGLTSLLGQLSGDNHGNSEGNDKVVYEGKENNSENRNYDRNLQMLKSVRSLVDHQRAKFIDKIIDMYKKGDISD